MKEKTLKYYTLGGENPNGKARVFYSAHPEDLDCFFDEIKSIILDQYPKSAIWYEDLNDVLSDDELSDALDEMQLVVIPVTEKLLNEANRTVSLVLSEAKKKHIPVFPLLADNAVKPVFTKFFGEVEYANLMDDDSSKVPLQEKVKNYLNRVLGDDETIKRIREEFTARIFLSYRKKDRSYTKRLLKSIHGNDRLRDVAIWYDEFLTYGEDYKESINEALNNSEIFMLMVTPNIIELVDGKPNFVMRSEYPAALEKKKRIIAVQMETTDRKQLENVFHGIPECIDGNDSATVSNEIIKVIGIKNTIERNTRHNFLIGLAYLDGIDVEKDYEKAISLIQEAANDGLVDAVSKMRDIYRNGVGVEVDWEEAIKWHEILINILDAEYEKTKQDSILQRFEVETFDFGSLLLEFGRIDDAERIYTRAIEKGMKYVLKGELGGSLYTIAFLNSLGEISEVRGKYIEAREYYNDSLNKIMRLAEQYKSDDEQFELGMNVSIGECYDHMAEIEKELGNIEASRDYYLKAIELAQSVLSKSNTVERKHDLFAEYDGLYYLDIKAGKFDEALDYYMSVLEERERIAKDIHTNNAQKDLLIAYERISLIKEYQGQIKTRENDYEGGQQLFNEALTFLLKSYENGNDSSHVRFRVAWLYYCLAGCMERCHYKAECIVKMLDHAANWLKAAEPLCQDQEELCKIEALHKEVDRLRFDIKYQMLNL